jgi:drug/metabolite transporter (DMT)-like permease
VFPLGELIRFEERFICGTCKPIFFQRLREGAVLPSAHHFWRKGKLLITEKGAVLPDRCIKCNGPIEGRRIAKILYWHPPWVYLLLLVTLLLYVVVALIIRKKAPIVVPICDRHYHVRLVAIISAWLAGIGGLAVFFYGLSQADGVMAIIGILGIIAGAVIYSVKGVLVSARKLTEEHLWVHGCGPEYLKAFAEWPGKP